MRITADPRVENESGHFGEVGRGGLRLHVSPAVFAALRVLGARTAESLYDQASASPDHVARLLNWTSEDVRRAVGELREALRETHPELLEAEDEPMPRYGFGAMPPRSR